MSRIIILKGIEISQVVVAHVEIKRFAVLGQP
jgi:hypothetical protein